MLGAGRHHVRLWGGPHTYDLNRNGLPEVIWPSWTTRIFEYPRLPTMAEPASGGLPVRLEVVPNPCRAEAALRLAAPGEIASTLRVFDVRGRLVEQLTVNASTAAVSWRPTGLPAGVYLIRLEDGHGRALAAGRGTIVR
jgi:hypothetical protein